MSKFNFLLFMAIRQKIIYTQSNFLLIKLSLGRRMGLSKCYLLPWNPPREQCTGPPGAGIISRKEACRLHVCMCNTHRGRRKHWALPGRPVWRCEGSSPVVSQLTTLVHVSYTVSRVSEQYLGSGLSLLMTSSFSLLSLCLSLSLPVLFYSSFLCFSLNAL